jgi:hypothetical protein
MAHVPPALRDMPDSDMNINQMVSQSILLDYYDDLTRDSVFNIHNYSYIFYRNYTSSLDVNGVYIDMKRFHIKDIKFLKERFFLVQGQFKRGDKTIPTTLIKYISPAEKAKTNQHILTNLHNCIIEQTKDPER